MTYEISPDDVQDVVEISQKIVRSTLEHLNTRTLHLNLASVNAAFTQVLLCLVGRGRLVDAVELTCMSLTKAAEYEASREIK